MRLHPLRPGGGQGRPAAPQGKVSAPFAWVVHGGPRSPPSSVGPGGRLPGGREGADRRSNGNALSGGSANLPRGEKGSGLHRHRSGLVIGGPPPRSVFVDVPREALLKAMSASMAWHRAHEQGDVLLRAERVSGMEVRGGRRPRFEARGGHLGASPLARQRRDRRGSGTSERHSGGAGRSGGRRAPRSGRDAPS